ncbi:hypothetical protein MMC12_000591 [Toensbergia leucococca]|nr:hypothetical protein [Toensbergia leucococca]
MDVRGFVQRTLTGIVQSWKIRQELESEHLPSVGQSSHSQTSANRSQYKTPAGSCSRSAYSASPKLSGQRLEAHEPNLTIVSETQDLCEANSHPQRPISMNTVGHETQETVQYTEGLSRVIIANDGTKDCLAVLLTQEMVSQLNQIIGKSSQVKAIESRFDDTRREANILRIYVEQSKGLIEATDNEEEKAKLGQEISEKEEEILSGREEREYMEEEVKMEKRSLEFLRIGMEELFSHILAEADLLNLPESEDKSYPGALGTPNNAQQSTLSSGNNKSKASLEDLYRRRLYEDVQLAKQKVDVMQKAFDTRHADYEQDLMAYQQAVFDGECDLPRTQFDLLGVEADQILTRAVIDAEAGLKEAKERARNIGALSTTWDQESNFRAQSDGYADSYEASAAASVNRNFIEAWMEGVESARNNFDDPVEPPELDDWNARSVEISDSISMVDYGPRREKIDRWRATCEQ